MKHTEGTTASLPERFRTFHLKGCELLSRAHSSPLWTVICKQPQTERGQTTRAVLAKAIQKRLERSPEE